MPSEPNKPRWPAGAAATVACGVTALVVVVVTAGSAKSAEVSGRQRGTVVVGQAMSGFLLGGAAMVLVLGVVLWLILIRNGRGPLPSLDRTLRSPWWVRSAVAIGLMMLAVLAVGWLRDSTADGSRSRELVGAPATSALGEESSRRPPGTGPAFFAGLGVAVVGIAVLGLVTVRRLRDEEVDDDDGQDSWLSSSVGPASVVAALEVSLEGLEGETDPRRAVLAAYAAMQRVLGAAGVARRPSETEPELFARALRRFGGAAAPADRLTKLFERARYSPHVVDEAMRTTAIETVLELRDGLRVNR